jgi:hypothetical protein
VDFLGWYKGHPGHSGADFGLTGERAVIIGNGSVALDVARILLTKNVSSQSARPIATVKLVAIE